MLKGWWFTRWWWMMVHWWWLMMVYSEWPGGLRIIFMANENGCQPSSPQKRRDVVRLLMDLCKSSLHAPAWTVNTRISCLLLRTILYPRGSYSKTTKQEHQIGWSSTMVTCMYTTLWTTTSTIIHESLFDWRAWPRNHQESTITIE